MSNPFDDPMAGYCVLLNEQSQYSLWPDYLQIPAGWTSVGPRGNKETCSKWIDEVWSEMYAANAKSR